MKNAVELFKSQAYSQAENLFLQAKDEDRLVSSKYLFLISKALKKADAQKRFNDYLEQLFLFHDYKTFLALTRSETCHIEARNWKFHLNALWSEGKIEGFAIGLKRYWKALLEEKIHCKAEELFQAGISKHPLLLANYIYYLVHLCEINHQEKAVEIANHASELIEKSWEKLKRSQMSQGDYLKVLRETLSSTPVKGERLEACLFEISRKIKLKEKALMDAGNLMEYIIFFKSRPEALIPLLEGNLLSDPGEFLAVLKNTFDFESDSLVLEPRLKKLLRPKVAVVKKTAPKKDIDSSFTIGGAEEYIVECPASRIVPNVAIAQEEKEILGRIKAKDPEILKFGEQIAYSLMEIGYYEAAQALCAEFKDDSRFFYLRCHILNELGKDYELLDYVRELISTRLTEEEEKAPFYYFFGVASLNLGRKQDANFAFKRVTTFDPTFRNARELLKRAQN